MKSGLISLLNLNRINNIYLLKDNGDFMFSFIDSKNLMAIDTYTFNYRKIARDDVKKDPINCHKKRKDIVILK
jgi:hypothetical protein